MTAPARERTPFNNPGATTFARASTADMAELLREGATVPEVAEAFGLSWTGVRDRLIEGGWSSGTGQPIATERPVRVVADAGPDLSWQADGRCTHTNPEVWFPKVGSNGTDAKRICRNCPVRVECLDYAMSLGVDTTFGIWGGTSKRERLKARKAAQKEAS
jgi:WhiB family redox-sensing transcriptional regulator